MKAVVFGGSGFLGSHVADALSERGHKVVVYDMCKSLYLQESQEILIGDIRDEKKVEAAVKGADYVYNFAGIAGIDKANEKPLETVYSNVLGNSTILEACRKAAVKRFIFASSVYVYSKMGGVYRSTKQACEILTENYNETFDLPYTILRYGSLYGPRTDENNSVHGMIRQALTEKTILRKGDGEEIREYVHVYDAARCSVDILAEEFANQSVIITGNQQMKVKDLMLMVKEILNNDVEIKYAQGAANYHYEVTPYTFTPKLAKRITGKAYIDLGQGILKCIQDMYNDLTSQSGIKGGSSAPRKSRKKKALLRA